MYLNRDATTKKMKRANEERCRMKRANEDQEETDERRKCRSLNSIIYGIIILVRFIFVIIISVPRDECVPLIFTLFRELLSSYFIQ